MVKNLALMVYVTVGSAAYPILEFLEEWGTENFEVSTLNYVDKSFFVTFPVLLTFLFIGNFTSCYYPSHKDFCQWVLGGYSPWSWHVGENSKAAEKTGTYLYIFIYEFFSWAGLVIDDNSI